MKKIVTKDNSITFFNEKYQDIYHSTAGARTEAIEKFVRPLNLNKLIKKKDSLNVLDVCFGLGYTSAALIDEYLNLKSTIPLNITGLENDINIIKKIEEINAEFECYNLFKGLWNKLEFKKDNIFVKIILDDARISVKKLLMKKKRFDIVLFDPFAPKKQPELWTQEFITDISNLMKEGAVLTTYSCAKEVRERMRNANLEIKNGPCVGRKAPSTIAYKD